MSMMSHPAFGPKAALGYITVGALMDVWTAAYYFFYVRTAEPGSIDGAASNATAFWLTGLFVTGLVLMTIGFFLGRIGRAARKAELPPSEVAHAEAAVQQTAAATNPQVVTGAPPGLVIPTTPAAPAVAR